MPRLKLPEIPKHALEKGKEIYALAQEAGLTRGRPRKVVYAASVYAACRIGGLPLTVTEVSTRLRTPYLPVAKTYRVLVARLGLHPAQQKPEQFIARNAGMLKREVVEEALKIVNSCDPGGRKPSAVAAAAVYLASKGKLDQKVLAKIFSTTTVTINSHVRWLQTTLNGKGEAGLGATGEIHVEPRTVA